MAGFLKKAAGFMTYKEPQNDELGFELLEEQSEGGNESRNNGQQPQPGAAPQDDRDRQDNNDDKGGHAPGKDEGRGRNPFSKKSSKREKSGDACNPPLDPELISESLCDNLITIKRKFKIQLNQDIIVREFKIGRKLNAFMVYVDEMVDKNTLNLSVFPQLMSKDIMNELDKRCYPLDYLIENVLTVHKVEKSKKVTEIILHILNGSSALFVDGCADCLLLETKGFEKRSVGQPITEKVVKGSQEAFSESLHTNISLLRRSIKNEKLMVEMLPIGNMDNSMCAVIYLDGIANGRVVQEVKRRIQKINTDFLLGDGMLEQFIEDNSFMLFPQIIATERPDRTASFIMEGQVVVIHDGTPFALAMPITFFRLLHTSEDANNRWLAGTFLRFIRIVGLFVATFLPGIYVAIVLFHPEAIPTELLASIALAKEPVPFPTVVEILILELAFELIREGGLRIPTAIGQTLGIVGAIILGQAAVAAGLVSPILVIVVSITALGSFVIPNYELGLAIRIERFFFIFAGAALGIYGLALLTVVLAVLSCSMKSFGVPYFSPIAPKTQANPDVIIRWPIWIQRNRPDGLQTPNKRRQGTNVKNWSKEKN